jgi:peptidoglycan hydrolase-like protein with peptidoglycan-binding domain
VLGYPVLAGTVRLGKRTALAGVLVLTLPAAATAASGGASPSGGASVAGGSTTVKGGVVTGDSKHLGGRVLRPGMSGHDVRVLQDFLTRAGFPTPIVGHFGPTTEGNVIAFERSVQMTPNGVVSFAVAHALRAAVAAVDSSPAPGGKARLNADGTVTAPANAPVAVQEVIAAANRIAFKPYIYGGGHGSFNSAGYDCSGSVSYALHGAGLLSSPEDSSQFESYGSSGSGSWITIWANPGHAYMEVAGVFFDTAAQSSSNSNDRWSASRASPNGGFVVRHPAGL